MYSRSQVQMEMEDLAVGPQPSRAYETVSYSKGTSTPLVSMNSTYESQNIEFTSQDVVQVMDLLCSKTSRLFTKFSNNRLLLDQFKQQSLYNNTFMKIAIRKILYELANERKLGNGLKGMSKLLYQQIEDQMWELIKLEIRLFRKQDQIRRLEPIFKKDATEIFKM